jgi:hypothetical protein
MPLRFQPKIGKVVELLLYLAHARPNADKYQAVKFFYLADREHLNRFGRPITYDNYYALDYGPVASTALDILNSRADKLLKDAGIDHLPFEMEKGKLSSGHETVFIRKPLRDINQDLFSKSDLKVFDEIISEHGNATFEELFLLTHVHAAYVNAWGRRGYYSKRSEMHYEEMIEDEAKRTALVDDLAPIASHMQ